MKKTMRKGIILGAVVALTIAVVGGAVAKPRILNPWGGTTDKGIEVAILNPWG